MYDRLKSGSWIRWFVALVVCVALFLLRRKLLGGAETPDSFWQGYTPAEVASLFTRGKYAFLVVSLAAHLIVWLHKQRERLVYFYLVRFPLLLGLALLLLPVLSCTGFSNALDNLYVLGPWELFAISLAAVLAAAAVLVNARLVLLYGHLRFGVPSFGSPTAMPLWQPLLALAAAWWLIVFALARSFMEASGRDLWLLIELLGGALLGTAAALAIVWIGETLRILTAEPASLDRADFRERSEERRVGKAGR